MFFIPLHLQTTATRKPFHRPRVWVGLALASLVLLSLESCSPSSSSAQVAPKFSSSRLPAPSGVSLIYEGFSSQPGYPETSETFWNRAALNQMTPEDARIKISLGSQRAFLMSGDEIVIDYPISVGSHPRPATPGTYRISERTREKQSRTFGTIHDRDGRVVETKVVAKSVQIPEGGKSFGDIMPYWLGLSGTDFGMHAGEVTRLDNSHHHVKGHQEAVAAVFSKVRVGTPVEIAE